jgi:2-methylfumaryl-CoA hydratase
MSICRALSHDGLENAFAIAAINGGTHANPTFAGDTLYCRHVVLDRWAVPGRTDLGAPPAHARREERRAGGAAGARPGERHESVVLDLDYTVLVPRRKAT